MSNVIAYYRVSTDRQRRSGLGIEAQRGAVHRFAEAEGLKITSEYVEAESGKGTDALERRPQLAAALGEACVKKCPVLVAKLDRLSRDVAFVAGRGRRRPLHAPPLCRARGEGAPAHRRAHAPRAGRQEGERGKARQPT